VRSKFVLWIFVASFGCWTGRVVAQVATDPGLQSKPVPSPVPLPSVEPTIPERAQIDEIFKQTSLGKEADERRLHLEWRELANRIGNDGDIIAAKQSVRRARTDLEKRQRLRDYYELYYGRMREFARSSEMKTALDQLRIAHISRTAQPHVRASEDGALPTASPTPKKKAQKGGRLKKFQSNE
jgi:hypothetical protein